MGTYKHIDAEGNKTELKDLDLTHLVNIIANIERRARHGLVVCSGGGTTAEDMWYDQEIYYGKDVKKLMHYKKYIKELKKRSSCEIDFKTE